MSDYSFAFTVFNTLNNSAGRKLFYTAWRHRLPPLLPCRSDGWKANPAHAGKTASLRTVKGIVHVKISSSEVFDQGRALDMFMLIVEHVQSKPVTFPPDLLFHRAISFSASINLSTFEWAIWNLPQTVQLGMRTLGDDWLCIVQCKPIRP